MNIHQIFTKSLILCLILDALVLAYPPQPPIRVLNPVPLTVYVGQTVSLDGQGVFECDDEGYVDQYEWILPPQAYCISGQNTSAMKCKFFPASLVGQPYTVELCVRCSHGLWNCDPSGYPSYNRYLVPVTVHQVDGPWYVKTDGSNDANGLSWDTAFASIQTGIDSAEDGQEVLVREGTYYEQIDFNGKMIDIYSSKADEESLLAPETTIVDANNMGTTVFFRGNESRDCQLRGFTIRNGFPVEDKLELHLKLDETGTETTVYDDSGKGRSGLLNNFEENIWIDGKYGNALEFDGTDDYVQIVDYKGIAGTASRTCCAWIKTSQAGREIISWGPNATGSKWIVRINDYGQLRAEVCDGYIYGTTVLTDGQWHLITVTLFDDGNPNISEAKLYVDGQLEPVGAYTARAVNTDDSVDVRIGVHHTLSRYFEGVIDDVRIYERVLSKNEILQMFNLAGHWKLDSNTVDSSGELLDGISYGDPNYSIGIQNQAMVFDGKDDYVELPSDIINPAENSFSVFAWVRLDAKQLNSYQVVLQQCDVSINYGRTLLWRNTDDRLCSSIEGIPTISTTAVFSNTSQWRHVGVTYDGQTVTLYADGVACGSALRTAESCTGNLYIGIHKSLNTATCWNGLIDDVWIYNHVISDSEIQALYQQRFNVGGGIQGHGTEAAITQCIITQNESSSDGGGIADCNGFISDCKITENYAPNGGGMYNYRSDPNVINCVFESNTAMETGGAVYNVYSDPEFKNCEFKGNLDYGQTLTFPVISVNIVDANYPDAGWHWQTSYDLNQSGYCIVDPLFIFSDQRQEKEPNSFYNEEGYEYRIRWGRPVENGGWNKSGLGFIGNALISFQVNTPFEIGRLQHFNYTIGIHPENNQSLLTYPSKVQLKVKLNFDYPKDLSQVFDFIINVEETNNDCHTPNCSDDHITLPDLYPSKLIVINGRVYTLEIIGFKNEDGEIIYSFDSKEGQINTFYLWGKITPPPINASVKNIACNVSVENCLFVGNHSCSQGGAISNWSCENVFINNSTITGNHGNFCGGIYNYGSNIEIANTILWGNTDPNVNTSITEKQLYNLNSNCTVSYSCIQDDDPNDPNIYEGQGNIDDNPEFQEVPTNGGDGWGDDPNTPQDEGENDNYGDLRLKNISLCIDAGDPFYSPSIDEKDLDGNTRMIDGNQDSNLVVDIGAYEYQGGIEDPNLKVDAGPDRELLYKGNPVFLTLTAQRMGFREDAPAVDWAYQYLNGAAWTPVSSQTDTDVDIAFSSQGTYLVKANCVEDNINVTDYVLVTVRPDLTFNQKPTVSAWEKTGQSSTSLTKEIEAVVSEDGRGNPDGCLSVEWVVEESDGGTIVFSQYSATEPNVVVTFSRAGQYILKLTADDGEYTAEAKVPITVESPGTNHAPVVTILKNAVAFYTDQDTGQASIQINELTGISVSDQDDDPLNLNWTVSGNYTDNLFLSDWNNIYPVLTFVELESAAGKYFTLTLTASDGQAVGSDSIDVFVQMGDGSNGDELIVEAGANKLVQLPQTSEPNVTVWMEDANSLPSEGVTYQWFWTQASQGGADIRIGMMEYPEPAAQPISEQLNPQITFTQPGLYQFTLKASYTRQDNTEITGQDIVWVTVKPGEVLIPPRVLYVGTTRAIGMGGMEGTIYCIHPHYGAYIASQRLGAAVCTLEEYKNRIFAGTFDYKDNCCTGGGYEDSANRRGFGRVWGQNGSSWKLAGDGLGSSVADLSQYNDTLYAVMSKRGGTIISSADIGLIAYTNNQYKYIGDTDLIIYPSNLYIWNNKIYLGSSTFPTSGGATNTYMGYYDTQNENWKSSDYDCGGVVVGEYNNYIYSGAGYGINKLNPNLIPVGDPLGREYIIGGSDNATLAMEVFDGLLYFVNNNKLYSCDGTTVQELSVQGSNWPIIAEIFSVLIKGHDPDYPEYSDKEGLLFGTGTYREFCRHFFNLNQNHQGKVIYADGEQAPKLIATLDDCYITDILQSQIKPPMPPGELNFEITASEPNVQSNDELTYIIQCNDPNGFPHDIERLCIVDYLPKEVDFLEAGYNGAYNEPNHTVMWYLGTLNAQDTDPADGNQLSVRVRINETAKPGGKIINRYEIETHHFFETAQCVVDVNDWAGNTIIHVNDDSPIDGNGTSWQTAYHDLQQALDNSEIISAQRRANEQDPNIQIWVAAGTYFPAEHDLAESITDSTFQLFNGVKVYGSFAGTETTIEQRDLTDPDNKTILTGRGIVDHVVSVVADPSINLIIDDVLLDGLTITKGIKAGVYIVDVDAMTIINCQITENDGYTPLNAIPSVNPIAGIVCFNSSPTIENNIISLNNHAGIYCERECDIQIHRNRIYRNGLRTLTAANNNPVGICLKQVSGNPVIQNNVIYNHDYGIYIKGSYAESQVTIGINLNAKIFNNTIISNKCSPIYSGWYIAGVDQASIGVDNCLLYPGGNTNVSFQKTDFDHCVFDSSIYNNYLDTNQKSRNYVVNDGLNANCIYFNRHKSINITSSTSSSFKTTEPNGIYNVADIIQIGNEDVPRYVTKIGLQEGTNVKTISFAPTYSSGSFSEVYNFRQCPQLREMIVDVNNIDPNLSIPWDEMYGTHFRDSSIDYSIAGSFTTDFYNRYRVYDLIEIIDDNNESHVVCVTQADSSTIKYYPSLDFEDITSIVNWSRPHPLALAFERLKVERFSHLKNDPNNPCIDRGDPNSADPQHPTYQVYQQQLDIDGQPRVLGKYIDIGADEISDFAVSIEEQTLYVNPGQILNIGQSGDNNAQIHYSIHIWDPNLETSECNWSVISGDESHVLWFGSDTNITGVTFSKAGIYKLQIELYETAPENKLLGCDVIECRVGLISTAYVIDGTESEETFAYKPYKTYLIYNPQNCAAEAVVDIFAVIKGTTSEEAVFSLPGYTWPDAVIDSTEAINGVIVPTVTVAGSVSLRTTGLHVLNLTVRSDLAGYTTIPVYIQISQPSYGIWIENLKDQDKKVHSGFITYQVHSGVNGMYPQGTKMRWIQVSGPADAPPVGFHYTETNPGTRLPDNLLSFYRNGTYCIALQAIKDNIVLDSAYLNVTTNNISKTPIVEAGWYGPCVLEGGSVHTELVSDKTWIRNFGDSPVKHWSVTPTSGCTISNPDTLLPTLTFTHTGQYTFTLSVNKPGENPIIDTMTVKVYSDDSGEMIVDPGQYDAIAPGQILWLDEAFIWPPGMSGITCKWNGDEYSTFTPEGDNSHESSILQPVVSFNSLGDHTLTFTVTIGTQTIVRTTKITVTDTPEIPPESISPLVDMLVTSNGRKLTEGTAENPCQLLSTDSLVITVNTSDNESGLRIVSLSCIGLVNPLINKEYALDAAPVKTYSSKKSLSLSGFTGGPYTLTAYAKDKKNNEATKTFVFNVSTVSSDKPVAQISNMPQREFKNEQTDTLEYLPFELDKAIFEVQGLAYHPDASWTVVKYKLEVYKEDAWYYPLDQWKNLDGYGTEPDYFVENVLVGTDDDGFINGEVDTDTADPNLGQINLTGIPNGTYCLLLTVAAEKEGAVSQNYAYAKFTLDSPLKIGNIKFSQEDVVISVGGVPLQVVRTYDSFKRKTSGEFGFGWSYSIIGMDIDLNETRQTLQPSYAEEDTVPAASVRVGSNYDRDVTLTLPDGRDATFEFDLELKTDDGPIPYYIARYRAPEGVDATLEAFCKDDPDQLERLVFIPFTDLIGWNGIQAQTGVTFDPAAHDFGGYRLTTEDGTRYLFQRQELTNEEGVYYDYDNTDHYWARPMGRPYLSEIITSTGEKIDLNVDEATLRIGKYGDNGIEHYLPGQSNPTKAIRIDYDSAGRIEKIWAPAEQGGDWPTVWYSYINPKTGKDEGNLTAVHKLADKSKGADGYETLTYEYEGPQYDEDGSYTHSYYPSDHYITKINDPRGLTPIQYVYDDAGRLIATIDAKGNRIAIEHDTAANTEIIYDRDDLNKQRPTRYVYDSRGNVLETAKYDGSTLLQKTTYTYDSDNPLEISNVKTTTTQVPDYEHPGETLNATTTYDYVYGTTPDQTDYGKLLSQTVTDPVKNQTVTVFDASGNVTSTTQNKWDESQQAFVEVLTSRTQYITKIENGNTVNTGLPYLTGTTTGPDNTLIWHSISLTYYDDSNRVTCSVQVNMDDVEYADLFDGSGNLKSYDDIAELLETSSVTEYHYFTNPADPGYSPDQPSYITGPDGQVQLFSYDENNIQIASWNVFDDPYSDDYCEMQSVSDYDDAERVIRSRQVVTNVAGTIAESNRILSQTFYTSLGKVDYTLDENGTKTVYDYDETGNAVQTSVFQSVEKPDPQNPGQTIIVYEPLTVTQTLYDKNDRVIVSVSAFDAANPDAAPTGTETVFDALGRAVKTRQWNNVRLDLQRFKVNTQGQKVFESQPGYASIAGDPVGMSIPSYITVANAWDGTGTQPTSIGWTSENSLPVAGNETNRSETEYDTAGRVWKTYAMKSDRSMVCTNEYYYDLAGRQVEVVTLPGDPNESVTSTEYDGSRRKSVTDGRENTTEFIYDELGRVITTIHPASSIDGGAAQTTYSHVGYDGMGRKSWEAVQTVHDGTGEHPVLDSEKKFYGYDSAGRLISVKMPAVDDPQNSYTSTNPLFHYYYDTYGNQVCILDDKGKATLCEYDFMHRLVKRYQSYQTNFSPSTTQTRPVFNDILSQKPGNLSFEQNWYGTDGRIWKEKDFEGRTALYYYYTQSNGMVDEDFFGTPGQLRFKDYYSADPCPNPTDPVPDPDTTNQYRKERFVYTYNRFGQKLTETVFDCSTNPYTETYYAEYGYTDEGQLESITTEHNGQRRMIKYVYDPVTGQKTDTQVWVEKLVSGQMTWVEDASTDYDYDALGRLSFVTANKRNESQIYEQTHYTYDLNGNRKTTTLPNGVYTWYDYNALNRLTTLKHFSQYETTPENDTYRISSFAYKLNAQGMRTGITEFVGQDRYLAYQYDALNRVIQEDSYDDSTMNPAADDGYTALYEYDLAGNRLGRQVTVVRNSSNPESNILSTEYTEYDCGDRLRKEHSLDQAIFAAIPQGENDRIFAFADGQGGFGYKLSDSTTTIGQFKAFLVGLPSVWNRVLLIALMVCVPIAFLWPTIMRLSFRSRSNTRRDKLQRESSERPTLSLYHRSLCVLFTYIFLIGTETLQSLAYTDTQYHQLSTQAWGHAGDYITYYYDANGSLTYKIYSNQDTTADPATIVANNTALKYDKSEYNLQNRLSKLIQYSKPDADAIRLITEYTYNPDGIRVGSKSYKTVNNGTAQDKTTTDYLVDPANHTGYAQVLEEWTTTYDASDVPTTQNRIAYTIGDDIISQTKSDWTWNTGTSEWDLTTLHDIEYLLYDGQGSTRQLVRPNKSVIENYNYDSYGIMLGGNPTSAAPAATKLLYTGEQFDTAAQNYYLRARYYDAINGRFTQMDPYGGNNEDPQSLHKYLYCHANPINGIDPSGNEISMMHVISTITTISLITSILLPAVTTVYASIKYDISLLSIAHEMMNPQTWVEVLVGLGISYAISFVMSLIFKLLTKFLTAIAGFALTIWNVIQTVDLMKQFEALSAQERAHALAVIVLTGLISAFLLIKSKPNVDYETKSGKYPSWTTVRNRVWKVLTGRSTPPQAKIKVRNNKTGQLEIRVVSKELHHKYGRSIKNPHKWNNLQDLWPWEHAAIDSDRQLGYKLIEVLQYL